MTNATTNRVLDIRNMIQAEIDERGPTRDLEDAAESVLRASYWRSVRAITDEAEAEVRAGRLASMDEVEDFCHESVDGSEWVIYTWRNFLVLRYSDHEDAHAEIHGSEGILTDSGVNWSLLAFCAMREDVRELLPDEDELFPDA